MQLDFSSPGDRGGVIDRYCKPCYPLGAEAIHAGVEGADLVVKVAGKKKRRELVWL